MTFIPRSHLKAKAEAKRRGEKYETPDKPNTFLSYSTASRKPGERATDHNVGAAVKAALEADEKRRKAQQAAALRRMAGE